jgi:hypothetical protein
MLATSRRRAGITDKGKAVFVRVAPGRHRTRQRPGAYSLIAAEKIDAAVELAKGCPIVTSGGGVDVGELTA